MVNLLTSWQSNYLLPNRSSIITWYISVAVRKTDAHSYTTSASRSSPKWLVSRLGPPNFRCPGAIPGKSINLKFSEMPSLVLGKVRKFQHRSSSRFRDILEKPEGWMKTPRPATNRVKQSSKKGHLKLYTDLIMFLTRVPRAYVSETFKRAIYDIGIYSIS